MTERNLAQFRFARHCKDKLEALNSAYLDGGDAAATALATFDADRDNIEAALRSAGEIAQADADWNALVSEFADASMHIMLVRQTPTERLTTFQHQIRASRILADTEAEGRALCNAALCHEALGQRRVALQELQDAEELQRRCKNDRGLAIVLQNIALTLTGLGDEQSAQSKFKKALDLARSVDDRATQASILANLGTSYAKTQEFDRARECWQNALVLEQERQHRFGMANALGNLGLLAGFQGAHDKALQLHQSALDLHTALGHQTGIAYAHSNIAACYSSLDEMEKAEGHFAKAIEVHRFYGDLSALAVTYYNLALLREKADDHAGAAQSAQEALRLFEKVDDPRKDSAEALIHRLAQGRDGGAHAP